MGAQHTGSEAGVHHPLEHLGSASKEGLEWVTRGAGNPLRKPSVHRFPAYVVAPALVLVGIGHSAARLSRMPSHLEIDPRYCGPPGTGNGGYVAGLLAASGGGVEVGRGVEVTLRAPAPLGRALDLVPAGEEVWELRDADQLLASARVCALELDLPEAPGFDETRAVAGRCRAFETHPFPRCFVCGPARTEGDGMCVFPGWLADRELAAAAWQPAAAFCDEDGRVRPEFLWAALDCPSAFPLLEDPEAQRLEPLVLGRLVARIEGEAKLGQRLVSSAWTIELGARKGLAGSAIHDESGACLARARATWISLAQA